MIQYRKTTEYKHMDIQKYILNNTAHHPHDIIARTMQHCKISRTTALRHMKHLIQAGKIIKTGKTRKISYALTKALKQSFTLQLTTDFFEHDFFVEHLQSLLTDNTNTNTFSICEYGITEMLNNCKDHSQGKSANIEITITNNTVNCQINDNGIGLFTTLADVLQLSDKREIMLELSKGKVTRDPANHSGEGIFFTSRAFDVFKISANKYCYIRNNIENDWTFYTDEASVKGTTVELSIARNSKQNLANIFMKYQDDGLSFVKTDVIIELSQLYGERLISRSQAQRVARNLDKFTHVTLDFSKVMAIGQGFVDQLFRVYKNQNKNITIDYINANSDVEFMIKRGIATADRNIK